MNEMSVAIKSKAITSPMKNLIRPKVLFGLGFPLVYLCSLGLVVRLDVLPRNHKLLWRGRWFLVWLQSALDTYVRIASDGTLIGGCARGFL